MLGHLAPNRYELYLSNEVLQIHIRQESAKISDVKVGGRRKIINLARFETALPGTWLTRRGQTDQIDFLFDLQL